MKGSPNRTYIKVLRRGFILLALMASECRAWPSSWPKVLRLDCTVARWQLKYKDGKAVTGIGLPDGSDITSNGQHAAVLRMFHTNGSKYLDVPVVNGKLHGSCECWYPNGHRARLGQFEDDVPVGVWLRWNAEGRFEGNETFSGTGDLTGTWSAWCPVSQTVAILSHMSHGKMNGSITWWNTNGMVEAIGRYADGNRDGVFIHLYPNGQLQSQGTFVADKRQGKHTLWFPNEREACVYSFTNDVPLSVRSWNPRGEVIAEGEFRNGHPWQGSFPYHDLEPWRYVLGLSVGDSALLYKNTVAVYDQGTLVSTNTLEFTPAD